MFDCTTWLVDLMLFLDLASATEEKSARIFMTPIEWLFALGKRIVIDIEIQIIKLRSVLAFSKC